MPETRIELKVRADVAALMTAHPMGEALAEQAYALARTLDGGVSTRDLASINRELRETLAELARMGVPDDDDLDHDLSTPSIRDAPDDE